MECRTAESLINSYIKKTMTIDELEQFLKHVEKCDSCYDELETYYTVYFAMQRLDSDKNEETFDIKEMLREDIRRRHHRIRRYKIRQSVLAILVLVVLVFLVLELGRTFQIII